MSRYSPITRFTASQCAHEGKCSDSYLSDLEKRTLELLSWRDYDEIQQAKAVVDNIIEKRDASVEMIDPKEVARAFQEEREKLMKRTRLVFPKVKRWANVTTIISLPVAVAGLASGASLVSLAGAAAAGMAQVGKEYVQFLESKYRWIGFLQSTQGPCREREGS